MKPTKAVLKAVLKENNLTRLANADRLTDAEWAAAKAVVQTQSKKEQSKMAKTQAQKRAAWKAYRDKNKVKYEGWRKGWRADSGVTVEAFLKKYKADQKAKRAAANKSKGAK